MVYKDMVLGTLTQTAFNERDNTYFEMAQEVEEVYRKAKAMGEIEQAYWKSDTPENFAYDFVRIFEKHFSNRKGGE